MQTNVEQSIAYLQNIKRYLADYKVWSELLLDCLWTRKLLIQRVTRKIYMSK